MYKCKQCERLFDTPETVAIRTGVFSEGRAEEFEVGICPNCGSETYENVYPCECCGEYTEDDFCDDCIEDMACCLTEAFISFKELHRDVKDTKMYDLAYDVTCRWEQGV